MDKHTLYNKIKDILILTQFRHWVEPERDHLTAEEIIKTPERAIDYYLGREKGRELGVLPSFEMMKFHHTVCLQASLIMKALDELVPTGYKCA